MATIEERATQLAYHEVWENCDTEFRTYIDEDEKKMYIDILTEQDRISRQEERERCIKAAQDYICNSCGFYKLCKIETTTDVGYYGANGTKCMDRVNIRKAMEGGSEWRTKQLKKEQKN